MSSQDRNQKGQELYQELWKLMQSEISVLREMLGNMKEEEMILKYGNVELCKGILEKRDNISSEINQVGKTKKDKIQNFISLLCTNKQRIGEKDLENLFFEIAKRENIECGDLRVLREHMDTLIGQIEEQEKHNFHLTKERSNRLPNFQPQKLPKRKVIVRTKTL